ncbi:oligosaccharyl transferase glycoprotein complex, beta subunit [Marasmius crinis-equi]|uniref:Dolichyl-diphosphooligosaccharide--protein glycosyltransferase subunit WBP1 n=1 Tax=Marasmius crinis-equi TaxID=585013 RepID=A0ABR3EZH9_9AGAR
MRWLFLFPLVLQSFLLLNANAESTLHANGQETQTSWSSSGDSVLVVLDPSKKEGFSGFLGGLEDKGYNLTFRSPKDADGPPLTEHDLPKYAHVVVVGEDVKTFAKDITPQTLVGLLSGNTNLIVALGTKQSILTSLAPEFGLILPPPNTNLVSHFPEREDPISVVPITPRESVIPLTETSKGKKGQLLFEGTPFALSNNPRLFPILNAPEESFAGDIDVTSDVLVDSVEKGGEGLWAGSKMAVVAGFQAKGGARVAWIGGGSLLQNKEKSSNSDYAKDVAAWAFQETNVLRIDSAEHKLIKGVGSSGNGTVGQAQEQYTVGDEIEFTMRISQYNPKFKLWEAYHGITDLQLEFTMLDPHVRIALPPSPGRDGKREKGVYRTTFKAPDRHGVFKFVVDWRRQGWTELQFTETVPVVPKRHDGYDRWLSAAWPYYLGAVSTSVGFVVFVAGWLASVDERGKGKKKAE